jgi:hypothetical protein
MASRRLSRLQRHILTCLMADYRRTQGGTLLGHYELVQSLGRDKSHVSHSLRTLVERIVSPWQVIAASTPVENMV